MKSINQSRVFSGKIVIESSTDILDSIRLSKNTKNTCLNLIEPKRARSWLKASVAFFKEPSSDQLHLKDLVKEGRDLYELCKYV